MGVGGVYYEEQMEPRIHVMLSFRRRRGRRDLAVFATQKPAFWLTMQWLYLKNGVIEIVQSPRSVGPAINWWSWSYLYMRDTERQLGSSFVNNLIVYYSVLKMKFLNIIGAFENIFYTYYRAIIIVKFFFCCSFPAAGLLLVLDFVCPPLNIHSLCLSLLCVVCRWFDRSDIYPLYTTKYYRSRLTMCTVWVVYVCNIHERWMVMDGTRERRTK